jgi:hypothetical protein
MGLSIVAVVPGSAVKNAEADEASDSDDSETSGSADEDSEADEDSGSSDECEYSRIGNFDSDCDMSYITYAEFRNSVLQTALGREYGKYMRIVEQTIRMGVDASMFADIN